VRNAEDVLHDVFVGLPEALRRYDERGRLEPWLKRVTARVALSRLRSQRPRQDIDVEMAATVPVRTAEELITLDAAVAALSPSLRAVLVLKEIEGFSHAEIAVMLGISKGARRFACIARSRRAHDAHEGRTRTMRWFGFRRRADDEWLEAVRPELRGLHTPVVDDDLLDKVLRSRAAGTRVILPDTRGVAARPSRHFILAALAAALLLLVLPSRRAVTPPSDGGSAAREW
jgi:hypothetical protein